MKTRESWLQNGIFIYKTGLSVTKQDFHLQNRILELQTGLSPCYLPLCFYYTTSKSKMQAFSYTYAL